MCPTETVHVLIEVHHLEAIELIGDRLNIRLLVGLLNLDTFGVPSSSRG